MPSHLTLQERNRIAHLRLRGHNPKQIACVLERCRSTISRELRRNRAAGEYYAAQAQRASERRRRERPLARNMDDPAINNGTQFARCYRLEKHLDMKLYFADPGCPFQRGTNENTNGLIRQYFPKGTDFRDVTHHEVREAERKLNNRPRISLGLGTPAEVFFEKHPPCGCDCD